MAYPVFVSLSLSRIRLFVRYGKPENGDVNSRVGGRWGLEGDISVSVVSGDTPPAEPRGAAPFLSVLRRFCIGSVGGSRRVDGRRAGSAVGGSQRLCSRSHRLGDDGSQPAWRRQTVLGTV